MRRRGRDCVITFRYYVMHASLPAWKLTNHVRLFIKIKLVPVTSAVCQGKYRQHWSSRFGHNREQTDRETKKIKVVFLLRVQIPYQKQSPNA